MHRNHKSNLPQISVLQNKTEPWKKLLNIDSQIFLEWKKLNIFRGEMNIEKKTESKYVKKKNIFCFGCFSRVCASIHYLLNMISNGIFSVECNWYFDLRKRTQKIEKRFVVISRKQTMKWVIVEMVELTTMRAQSKIEKK